MNYYNHIVARLDGENIKDRFDHYLDLTKKGIAGFIVFGGGLQDVRDGVHELQQASALPLIIASDLEQGVGQQMRGGTLFPPAMALTDAVNDDYPADLKYIANVFAVYAEEALYAGINMILAPVVDINTNPRNPIISVRSFGEDRETVSLMSGCMIEILQSYGVAACAKHFPGHGDTAIDSHLALPVLNKEMDELEENELYPFKKSIDSGVNAIMLGHISAPAIDPSGTPLSISVRSIEYVREKCGFKGVLLTDALNMGGLSSFGGDEAGATALTVGVDILLHPDDPDELNDFLRKKKVPVDQRRIKDFRRGLKTRSDKTPDFMKNTKLAQFMTERAVTVSGVIEELMFSSVVLIKEDEKMSYGILEDFVRTRYHDHNILDIKSGSDTIETNIGDHTLTIIFSTTAAWRGDQPQWIGEAIEAIQERTSLFIIFGNPYVVHGIDKPTLFAYWCSESAERAVVKMLKNVYKW